MVSHHSAVIWLRIRLYFFVQRSAAQIRFWARECGVDVIPHRRRTTSSLSDVRRPTSAGRSLVSPEHGPATSSETAPPVRRFLFLHLYVFTRQVAARDDAVNVTRTTMVAYINSIKWLKSTMSSKYVEYKLCRQGEYGWQIRSRQILSREAVLAQYAMTSCLSVCLSDTYVDNVILYKLTLN